MTGYFERNRRYEIIDLLYFFVVYIENISIYIIFVKLTCVETGLKPVSIYFINKSELIAFLCVLSVLCGKNTLL